MYGLIKNLLGKKIKPAQRKGMKSPAPVYNEVLRAYLRSFVLRDGYYHVGNHRMIEGFNVAGACESFARYKHAGCSVMQSVATAYNSTTGVGSMCVRGGGCVYFLNSNVPERELQATLINLTSQLRLKYDANITEALSKRECCD